MRHSLLLLLASIMLAGCGKKGDLYLPPPDDGAATRTPAALSVGAQPVPNAAGGARETRVRG